MLFRVFAISRALDCHSEFVLRGIDFNCFSVELAAGQFLALLSHSQLVILLVNLEAHLHVFNAVKIRLASFLNAAFTIVSIFMFSLICVAPAPRVAVTSIAHDCVHSRIMLLPLMSS